MGPREGPGYEGEKERFVMAVTIKDVAMLAGVSPSTVSRTCRNNPSISEETKEKVRRAAAQLGYQPTQRKLQRPL